LLPEFFKRLGVILSHGWGIISELQEGIKGGNAQCRILSAEGRREICPTLYKTMTIVVLAAG
jgi:hypothetical protein